MPTFYLESNNPVNNREIPNDIFVPLNTNRTQPRTTGASAQGGFTNNTPNFSQSVREWLDDVYLAGTLTLGTNNSIDLPAYGSGTFTGTPTSVLLVDANGNVIELTVDPYADDAAAGVGGVEVGQLYYNSTNTTIQTRMS
jgi:hypothetical protein